MEKSIVVSLVVPSALVGVAGAAGSFGLSHSWGAAVLTALSCVAAATAAAVRVNRAGRSASAQLRRPELRTPDGAGTGVYRGLLQEAIGLLETLERDNNEAARQRTELEARGQLRQKTTHRLEAALNCLEQPVLVTDAHDELLFCNPAASELLGLKRDRNSNGRSSASSSLDAVPALKQLVQETRQRNAATDHRNCELEVDGNGRALAFRAVARNVFENDETLLGVVTVLNDVGDERAQKTRHAEFVSSVCHELKTPMAGIKAYTEMLMDGDVDDPDEQQEMFGFIDGQVDRLTRLVNNMLNLARIESGVIKINRVDCELNDVLRKALTVVEPTAEEKQVRVVSELSELYFPVHVDTDVFGQAVINLLSNAVKYTPQGGEVRLKSRMEEDRAVIEVRDTGMGIPDESLPHIFDRFYRVPQNNKAAAGTGLGLALVHYIVTELHNGRIAVSSVVDEGSCFTITIPLGHVNQGRKKQDSQYPKAEEVVCSV